MKKYTVSGLARFVNGVQAIVIFASVITSAFLVLQHGAGFIPLVFLNVVLFVGVIQCAPLTYIGLVTLSLVGLSMALQGEHLVMAVMDALLMAGAIFVHRDLKSGLQQAK